MWKESDVWTLLAGEPGYPTVLATEAVPPILYGVGDRSLIHRKAVAVVGTRKPTEQSLVWTGFLTKALVKHQWVIVSGLAFGCDAAAHTACLDAGGQTIAVMGVGLHKVYPTDHWGLAERIVDNGGLLLAEVPWGDNRMDRGTFPRRNRIQSALAKVVVVVETDLDKGTMHTVRHAQYQGKQLAVQPGNYAGNQWCVENGAELLDGPTFKRLFGE